VIENFLLRNGAVKFLRGGKISVAEKKRRRVRQHGNPI
jgi:hypothetical protein